MKGRGQSVSLKKYEAFVKTVELGSLTNAADALGSTQSRISHILSDLEQEYGFTLLKRSRGGIQLTRAGAMIYPKMQQILKMDQELDDLIEDIREAEAGMLRLGVFTSVAVHWLPGMLRSFQAAHPGVDLKMFNGDYHDMEQWLKNKEIDVGFVTLPGPAGVKTIPLYEDPLVAIFPKNHKLAENPSVKPRDLEQEPFISLLHSSSHDIHRALDQAGIRPNIRFSTKDDYAILAMVQQGLGVSIVPELLLKGNERDLEIRPLDPPVSRTIALAIPGEETLPIVEAFAETAVSWLRKNNR